MCQTLGVNKCFLPCLRCPLWLLAGEFPWRPLRCIAWQTKCSSVPNSRLWRQVRELRDADGGAGGSERRVSRTGPQLVPWGPQHKPGGVWGLRSRAGAKRARQAKLVAVQASTGNSVTSCAYVTYGHMQHIHQHYCKIIKQYGRHRVSTSCQNRLRQTYLQARTPWRRPHLASGRPVGAACACYLVTHTCANAGASLGPSAGGFQLSAPNNEAVHTD